MKASPLVWFCSAVLASGSFLHSHGQIPESRPARITPIVEGALDAATFAEWIDGNEAPIAGPDKSRTPQWLLWTTRTESGHSGLKFGESKSPGPRHLRIGLKEAVPLGSVIVRGGGRLSVLKPDAAYPGDLAREEDWLPAQRLVGGKVVAEEVNGDEVAIWTLPADTRSRALRFTHIAQASDPTYAGMISGAFVIGERWTDLASLASAGASAAAQDADRINNGLADVLSKPWANLPVRRTVAEEIPMVSQAPQWVMLSWPEAVRIGALVAQSAGFGSAEVQAYAGPQDKHPRDAVEADWKPVQRFTGIRHGYPAQFWPNLLAFAEPVSTRAIRLKLTSVGDEAHSHVKGYTAGGKRVWLGELLALQPLKNAALTAVTFKKLDDGPKPPIPVRFTLKEPGYVTLVIEKPDGMRVRNLVSETYFPAGENIAWWDGTDDLGRDIDAARHGVYKIPAQFVSLGTYKVRGLVRGEIDPRYEFSIYSAGDPVWPTADTAGGWLTNHSPPQAAIFVPAEQSPTGEGMIYLGSAVSEGGAGLAWVRTDGTKVGGRGWIGGNWTAAPYLARDAGANAIEGSYAYVGAAWTATGNNNDRTNGELRITALTAKGDKAVIKHPFTPPAHDGSHEEGDHHWVDQLGGLAVHNGVVAASMNKLGTLLIVDARTGQVLGQPAVESPRGVAFDQQGRLLVLSGRKLVRYPVSMDGTAKLGPPQTVIGSDLEDPQGITLDSNGEILISDGGWSHQVKRFSTEGKFLRAFGKAGAPMAGSYDPQHMNNPAGIALDSKGRLWVTERDFLPKRVSVWNPDGTLWRAFYGPAKYGGGGTLDPLDKTRFYYADEGRGSMELRLDWEKGLSYVTEILYRPEPADLKLPFRNAGPETPIYREGRRYFTNCYNTNPTGGHLTAFLFREVNGIATPAAAMGRTRDWPILHAAEFVSRFPAGSDLKDKSPHFAWSDLNADAQVQVDEVNFVSGPSGGVTVLDDLSFCIARVGDKALRFAPASFTGAGVPTYDIAKGVVLADGVRRPVSSGGDQALVTRDGWSVVTLGAGPFSPHSISGAKDGVVKWSYPNVWPGLHAGHEAPSPDRPGQLIAPTRLLGGLFTSPTPGVGDLWAINGNLGTAYLFTADGLFVATLFEDKRSGKSWTMPKAERNMSLKGLTLHEENFWPTLTQTSDCKVYLMNGGRASLVRLDGLDSIRRLPDSTVQVSAEDLQKAQTYIVEAEARRQQSQGRGVLEVALRHGAPVVDGKIEEWSNAAWVDIDKSGVAANFDSKSKPYDITAAVAISGDRLFAAYRTGNENLLQNSGAITNAPFKTGGALDLMLGIDPAADPKRNTPVAGDLRLLVTLVKGKPSAVLYRAVVPGTKTPVPFSSPWRTITLDQVEDVSSQVQLAGDAGNYEFSIPLATLGLKPAAGQTLRGDVGILRGDGLETTARVYWSNKASGITSDVPSEAMLTPRLWGPMVLQPAP